MVDAWEDFWNGEAPEDIVGTPEFEQMFLPWFVFGYVPNLLAGTVDDEDDAQDDDAEEEIGPAAQGRLAFGERVPASWPTSPLALEWLATQGDRGDALNRQYAETACRSPLSVFVIEGVVAGQSLDIRDVLTGARFHVLETGASRTLRVADLLFASVLTIDGISVMFGASPYVVPADWHNRSSMGASAS